MTSGSEFIRTDLETEAQLYLQHELSIGYSLSRLLLEMIRINSGKLFAYLPSDIEPKYLRIFEYALPRSSKAIRQSLVETIYSELNTCSSTIFIIEDPCKRGEPWLDRCRTRVKFVGEHVYHVCVQGDDPALITEAIKEGYSPSWFVSAITSFPKADNPEWLKSEELSSDDLTLIGGNASYVIISAWDDDGFIYWKRDQ